MAYQGEPGSYSEQAVWHRFAGLGARPVPCASFAAAVEALLAGDAQAAIIPLENNRIGPIGAAVDAIAAAPPGRIEATGSFWLPIDLCLIGHPDGELAAIERAYSHPAALAQVARFLSGHGIEAVAADDTAGAVREVRERGILSEAAVAGRRAAALHGMRVLAVGVQDLAGNRTRFGVYRRVHK